MDVDFDDKYQANPMIMRSLDWKVHQDCGNLGDIESLVEELRLPSHKKYSPLKVFFL
jgi:hypothetical protein